jgi:hypothetical protein
VPTVPIVVVPVLTRDARGIGDVEVDEDLGTGAEAVVGRERHAQRRLGVHGRGEQARDQRKHETHGIS